MRGLCPCAASGCGSRLRQPVAAAGCRGGWRRRRVAGGGGSAGCGTRSQSRLTARLGAWVGWKCGSPPPVGATYHQRLVIRWSSNLVLFRRGCSCEPAILFLSFFHSCLNHFDRLIVVGLAFVGCVTSQVHWNETDPDRTGFFFRNDS